MSVKLAEGMKLPDFTFQTPWRKGASFLADSAGSCVCLMFLRYYGCSTCQLEIHELIEQHPALEKLGVKLYVVLQSDPETLRQEGDQEDFPFDIICDPEQALYHTFQIGSNPDPEHMSAKLADRVAQARACGIVHGKFEGNEAQSPATFLLDREGVIRYAWYGVESADVPTGNELLQLIREHLS